MKIAVLCYHSWDMDPSLIERDITALRAGGWRSVSMEEIAAHRSGRTKLTGQKLFHVTDDDASPAHRVTAQILKKLDCPATFFLQTGLIPAELLGFYQELDRGGLIAVEDHSRFHRKVRVGPGPTAEGSELLPLFTGDAFETRGAYEKRVSEYLTDGRAYFIELFGRAPRAFCYPFFHRAAYAERCLKALGYSACFGGGNLYWDGKSFDAPRILLGRAVPRPVDLGALCHRSPAARAAAVLRRAGLGVIVDRIKKCI